MWPGVNCSRENGAGECRRSIRIRSWLLRASPSAARDRRACSTSRATDVYHAGYQASRLEMVTRKNGLSFSAGSILNSWDVCLGS